MGRLEAKYVLQNWPCCEHIVEDWWSEAVARLEPSKCSNLWIRVAKWLIETRHGSAHFLQRRYPFLATQGCIFCNPGIRKRTRFGCQIPDPKWVRFPAPLIIFPFAGPESGSILSPECGPKMGPFFGPGIAKTEDRQCHIRTLQGSRGRDRFTKTTRQISGQDNAMTPSRSDPADRYLLGDQPPPTCALYN